jgi:oligopeptide transport system substrate-binding protein
VAKLRENQISVVATEQRRISILEKVNSLIKIVTMRRLFTVVFIAILLSGFQALDCRLIPPTTSPSETPIPTLPEPETPVFPATPITLFSTTPSPSVPSKIAGTLNLDSEDPLTLDPAIASDSLSREYILQLYSGLVRLDDKLKPAADIAQRCELSNEGRTYTFYLRQDVKFHSGREVKAVDFKNSWERACKPITKSKTAADCFGDITGAKEVLSGKAKEISGVKVIDDYTLEVTIDAPKTYFLYKLTCPAAFVVDRDTIPSISTITKETPISLEWSMKPNGTGPFKFSKLEKGKSLVLDRNPLYYGEQAKIEAVKFNLEPAWPIDLYEEDTIDVVEVSSLYFDRVLDKTGPFYEQLRVVPALAFSGIGFDITRPPFDDINVRLAFSHAVDRDRLVKLVFQDRMQSADGVLPPGMPGYKKDLQCPEFNIAKAKELIAKSKYAGKLPPLTMTHPGWDEHASALMTAVLYEWQKNLGVEIKIRQLVPDRFNYHLKEEKTELFALDWTAEYPHPQNFLETLYRTAAERNYSGYSNSDVDTLLNKAAQEFDNNRSLTRYQEVEQKLINDAACLPLVFEQNYVLVKPYVKGYTMNSMGFTHFNTVEIEPHWEFSK